MTTKTWRDHVSAQFARDANMRLQRSINNRDRNVDRRKEITGEVYAVEVRHSHARIDRAVSLRQAQDIHRNAWESFRWAQLICEPLERLYVESMIRLRDWDRRRAS